MAKGRKKFLPDEQKTIYIRCPVQLIDEAERIAKKLLLDRTPLLRLAVSLGLKVIKEEFLNEKEEVSFLDEYVLLLKDICRRKGWKVEIRKGGDDHDRLEGTGGD
jgi:hypothetical protein